MSNKRQASVDAQGRDCRVRPSGTKAGCFFCPVLFFLVLMPLWKAASCFSVIIGNGEKSLPGGSFTFVLYGIALRAMTQAPVALAAGLRETSIFFGTIFFRPDPEGTHYLRPRLVHYHDCGRGNCPQDVLTSA
jgi:hypothetical protein